MNIYEKLTAIQSKLKAPKGTLNKFGNYNYRSCEDILESLKPVLVETLTALKIDNDLEVFNELIFRKSTVTLYDTESNESISTHTFTQESITRKGMSAEQCSGSTSSYGDKYCLGKMFLIDDTKDADTQDNRPQQNQQPQKNTGPMLSGDYVVQFGKKFKGQMLKTVDDLELSNFSGWISTLDDAKPIMLQTKMAIDIYLKEKGAVKNG